MERWERIQRETVAKELAQKILAFGCNVYDLDNDAENVITPRSIDVWANMSMDFAEEHCSPGEEPVFTLAEYWAVMQLNEEISVLLNAPKLEVHQCNCPYCTKGEKK